MPASLEFLAHADSAFQPETIMCAAQRRHHVAADVNEVLHAGAFKAASSSPGGQPDRYVSARRFSAPARHQRLRPHRFFRMSTGIRASLPMPERRDHLVAACEAVVGNSLDAARPRRSSWRTVVRAVKSRACRDWRGRLSAAIRLRPHLVGCVRNCSNGSASRCGGRAANAVRSLPP